MLSALHYQSTVPFKFLVTYHLVLSRLSRQYDRASLPCLIYCKGASCGVIKMKCGGRPYEKYLQK